MTTTQAQQNDPILSPTEASELIGVSKSTWLRYWRHKVPVIKLSPGRIGVRQSVLLAALEARVEGVD